MVVVMCIVIFNFMPEPASGQNEAYIAFLADS